MGKKKNKQQPEETRDVNHAEDRDLSEERSLDDNIVVVLDTSNYISSYSEEAPFKAKVIDKYDINIVVRSLKTGNSYELYWHQILESLDIEEIRNIICMQKYGY